MQLTLEQIKSITRGAVRITQENDGFHFYRFTKEQEDLYKVTNQDFYMKTFATSGVKFVFKTNSKKLYLRATVEMGSSRKFFSFDVFVNGNPIGYLDNFGDMKFEGNYAQVLLPQGTFDKSFDLGEGEKEVVVYFPWSMKAILEEVTLDGDSFVEGVKSDKVMIAYGDSITHGYDAIRPSHKYITLLAEALGVEEINKGIGGERFYGPLAECKDDMKPNYIVVAYGTNDWYGDTRKEFYDRCSSFYNNLCKNYPDVKIIGITPIWRADLEEGKPFGNFREVDKMIRDITKDYENVTIIDGFDFVPQDSKYFSDLYLHPNDKGFKHYFNNLLLKVKAII